MIKSHYAGKAKAKTANRHSRAESQLGYFREVGKWKVKHTEAQECSVSKWHRQCSNLSTLTLNVNPT